MDANAAYEVLKSLKPSDVVQLCRVNVDLKSRICNDQSIFRRLLEDHYPAVPLAKDGKYVQQYKQLAAKEPTLYHMHYVPYETIRIRVRSHDYILRFAFENTAYPGNDPVIKEMAHPKTFEFNIPGGYLIPMELNYG